MLTESNFLVVSDSALALLALNLLVVQEYVVLLLESFFVLYHDHVSRGIHNNKLFSGTKKATAPQHAGEASVASK